jgi:hypothetical protein
MERQMGKRRNFSSEIALLESASVSRQHTVVLPM